MLNKSKGNMYGFVTHTWNAIKGKCEHDCVYCYMKVWGKLNPIRLDKRELNIDLGEGNFIFVGSSTDMFASNVPIKWIEETIDYCKQFNNKYLFQSKNPTRFLAYLDKFPKDTILCTTLETNRYVEGLSKTPSIQERVNAMVKISRLSDFDLMVTIEPILDFDLDEFVDMIKQINPKYVAIGADSKNHNLAEPSTEKVDALIKELSEFDIKVKDNLGRLL